MKHDEQPTKEFKELADQLGLEVEEAVRMGFELEELQSMNFPEARVI